MQCEKLRTKINQPLTEKDEEWKMLPTCTVGRWRTGINQPLMEKSRKKMNMTLGFPSSILFGKISSNCPACVRNWMRRINKPTYLRGK
jgi:hypothetical protein